MSLAFLGDCDGPAETQLAEFAARAGGRAARIFGALRGLRPGADLLAWMRAHTVRAGGVLRQLGRPHRAPDPRGSRAAAASRRGCSQPAMPPLAARRRARIRRPADRRRAARGPALSPPEPTPLGWQHAQIMLDLIAVPLLLVLLAAVADRWCAPLFLLAAARARDHRSGDLRRARTRRTSQALPRSRITT